MNITEIFDLHCDTPFEMYHKKLPLDSKELDGGLSEFDGFSKATQIFAVWSDKDVGGQQNFIDFFPTVTNLEREIEKHKDVRFCTSREDLDENERIKIILSVEGADLLCANTSRLYELYGRGVRLLTLMWRDENCAGGAHNTEKGLSEFGKTLVRECEKLGIIIDLSHASRQTFIDVASESTKPFVATHSNAYSVCPHTRNLTDDEFLEINRKGGIVGVNFHPPFLIQGAQSEDYTPDELIDALCEHIIYFLSLGGEKTVCLGADRDGIPHIDGYTPTRNAIKLYEALLKKNIEEKIIKDIFGDNAKRFFETHLPSKGRI